MNLRENFMKRLSLKYERERHRKREETERKYDWER